MWVKKCIKTCVILLKNWKCVFEWVSGDVWYIHLKIENKYLKTCVKIHMGEKVYKINIMLFKIWK